MASGESNENPERTRTSQFNRELRIWYNEKDGLDVLSEILTGDRHSTIRAEVVALTINVVKGAFVHDTDRLLQCRQEIARPGTLPQIKTIHIMHELERAKYVVKEADFEIPTEEWFRVSADGYADSFARGEEDLEYEFPGDIWCIYELKRLLVDVNSRNCDVFLTTRIVWKQCRADHMTEEQNDHTTMQSVAFRVVSDGLEAVTRVFR